jgi:hypothetical protein
MLEDTPARKLRVTPTNLLYDEAVLGASKGCTFLKWAISLVSAEDGTRFNVVWSKDKESEVYPPLVWWARETHWDPDSMMLNHVKLLLCAEEG